MDYPHGQTPGAPIRSGIPEHGRIPKYYAVKAHVSLLIEELGEGGMLPTERDLAELAKLMDGVEVFEPDWSDIGTQLNTYVDAWKSATGS